MWAWGKEMRQIEGSYKQLELALDCLFSRRRLLETVVPWPLSRLDHF